MEPLNLTIDGKEFEVTQDNCGIAMFRFEEDDMDYLHVWADEDRLLFRQRELLLWMGGIAVKEDDERLIRLANREHGSFFESMGWSPRVYVEDHASEAEMDMYLTLLTKDLKKTKGVPKDFLKG